MNLEAYQAHVAARPVDKITCYRHPLDRLWYVECPCGWWTCHQSWELLGRITRMHTSASMRHAASSFANRSLDRFNVGGTL